MQNKKQQPKSRRGRGYGAFMAFCTGIMVVTLAAVLLVVIYVKPPKARIQPAAATTAAQGTAAPAATTTASEGEAPVVNGSDRREDFFTLLLAGTDLDGKRTDTIMLLAMDVKESRISVLNIPRDTRAYMENGKVHKINAAHNVGIDRMKTEIANTVGFEPDRYCILDYQCFEDIVDAIGGVYLDVPIDMKYKDPDQDLVIDIDKGPQTLDGERALHYMRFREDYPDCDLGRIRAQQTLIKAVAKKMCRPASLLQLPTLVGILREGVDTNLTAGEMIWLATAAIGVNSENLSITMLPGEPVGADYAADEEAVLALINEQFNPYTEPVTELNIPG